MQSGSSPHSLSVSTLRPDHRRCILSSYVQGLRSVHRSRVVAGLKLSLLILVMVDKTEAVSPIPAGLTELSTADGQQMLRNSTPTDQFWLLAQEFTTQDSQDWCGLASSSMVLNALPIPKPALNAFEGWVSSCLQQATDGPASVLKAT